jgi:hypothetical protein
MIGTDNLNMLFELGGAAMVGMSLFKLHKDKKVRGIHWAQILFFTSWGWWNLWFYPAVSMWHSFEACVAVTGVNTWYLIAMWYYIYKEHAMHAAQHGPTGQSRDKTWIETYTGNQFWALDPDPLAVDVVDVAHALAYQCRYNGHTSNQANPAGSARDFYSVAEHCCLLADYCLQQGWGPQRALQALVHDAGEAYTGDIPRPWKNAVPILRSMESDIDAAVLPTLGGEPLKPEWLDEIDARILHDERAQARTQTSNDWKLTGDALGVTINFWPPERAMLEWLERYYSLQEM